MNLVTSTMHRTAAIGLLAAVFCLVQLAGAREAPYAAGGIAQGTETGLVQVIANERGGFERAQAPESSSDPKVLLDTGALVSTGRARQPFTAVGASGLCDRALALPSIRAPPHSRISV